VQIPNELILEASLAALHVRIFDAQHHRALMVSCKQPVEQRSASVADMQMSGGRRREAHADWRFFGHGLMLTGEPEAHHLQCENEER
jgi:hypothetical protein